MIRKRHQIPLFAPIGLFALVVLPILLCFFLTSSTLLRQTYAIQFHFSPINYSYNAQDAAEVGLERFGRMLIKTFKIHDGNVIDSSVFHTLSRECSRVSLYSDYSTYVRVTFSKCCTYGDFVRAVDIFESNNLYYNILPAKYRLGEYELWGFYDQDKKQSKFVEEYIRKSEEAMLAYNSRDRAIQSQRALKVQKELESLSSIYVTLTARPYLYFLFVAWLFLLILNVIRLKSHTQQRLQLTRQKQPIRKINSSDKIHIRH
jgi:hypothetical protein